MTTIVTRTGKGSPLTHVEVDTNFTNLNTNKLEAGAIALGSAAAPSISFVSDTDTGIFSPGADQLAISTNGTRRLFITGNSFLVGAPDANACNLQIGDGATGNRDVFIDLVGDTTYNDYGARFNRSAGPNGITYVAHRGTGVFSILAQDAAPITFSTNNAERARIDSSGRLLVGTSSANANGGILQLTSGITFPATAVAASDANTLDDYEEGTWTPTLVAPTGAAVMTSGATGFYTKIGNLVTLSFNQISWSSKGTLAGAPINIAGFPFTSRNTNRQIGQVSSATAGAFTNANRLILSMEANQAQAGLYNANATSNESTPYSETSLGTSGILYGMSLTFNV